MAARRASRTVGVMRCRSEIIARQPVQQDRERPEALRKSHRVGESVVVQARYQEKGRRRWFAMVQGHSDHELAGAGFSAKQDAQHMASGGSWQGA